MQLLEVPYPMLGPQQVMVRTHFSLISIGTESKTVKDARAGYIAKARSRQEEVKKVIKAAKTFGIKDTYDMVMKKLEAPSALGYSCAGEVIGLGNEVKGLEIGDLVACGGGSAVHAEVVAVPQKLVAKVGGATSMDHAAFTTVGAIAMQGVRQADLRIGENCAIIGLGLLGLLTAQILHASGVKVIGIDLDPKKVALAKSLGFADSFLRHDDNLEERVASLSRGHGLDATIITAGTPSTDPVDLAGDLARHKGRVVVVGNVATGFKRKAYYRKELDLVMSCSYGPGRYDTEYEDRGLDYPIGHVRWTENRNMQAFLDLVDSKRIDLEPLVSKVIEFQKAPSAYDMIMKDASDLTGVLLKYDVEKALKASVQLREVSHASISKPVIGWIGAGNFAGNFLLPNVGEKGILQSVCNNRPNSSRSAADRFGFANCVSDTAEIISDEEINTVFITGRHESHWPLAAQALTAGKNVFVEKPLCLDRDQLNKITEAYREGNGRLMVGFNRRFAPFVIEAKRFMGSGPNGASSLSKERLEIFGKGRSAVIDDFKSLELHGDKQIKEKSKQDKGHAQEVAAFFSALETGADLPIPFEDCVLSTEASFMVLDSITENGARQYAKA